MALVMHQQFRGKNLARAFLLLPFIVPTVWRGCGSSIRPSA
jgi:ABC-type sugar transport system permease subunit